MYIMQESAPPLLISLLVVLTDKQLCLLKAWL